MNKLSALLISLLVCCAVGAQAANEVASVSSSSGSCNKKFQHALVISGMELAPGVALGILAGARASGNKPDVVITTCGSSIGAAIANAFPNPEDAKAFVMSKEFHKYLLTNAVVGKTNSPEMLLKIIGTKVTFGAPNVFKYDAAELPEALPRMLPRQDFTSSPGETKLITVAARALYTPDADTKDPNGARYEETFFTDKETAKTLKGLPAAMKKEFPDMPLRPTTVTRSDISTVQASRASIAEPYLINPAKIGNDYYLAGGMDLYPIETAKAIACSVTATRPPSDVSWGEKAAFQGGFGFDQAERVAHLDTFKNVNWMKMQGEDDLKMDPDADGLTMVSHIPADYEEFKALVEKEYQFGYERALDAYGVPSASSSAKKSSQQVH